MLARENLSCRARANSTVVYRRCATVLFWKVQMTSMDGETLYVEATSLYIIPRSHAKQEQQQQQQ